jgi:peptide deformylase
MARREILILPDKRLRQVSEPVKKIDAGIRALVEDMFESMYEAPGIGLAAIQLGTPSVVTMDLAKKDDPRPPRSSSIRKSCGRRRRRRPTRKAASRSPSSMAMWSGRRR